MEHRVSIVIGISLTFTHPPEEKKKRREKKEEKKNACHPICPYSVIKLKALSGVANQKEAFGTVWYVPKHTQGGKQIVVPYAQV